MDASLEKGQTLQATKRVKRFKLTFHKFLCIVILLAFILISQRGALKSILSGPWTHCYHATPKKYAICSLQERNVYTVDTANNVVECFAVADGVISHVGSRASLRDADVGEVKYLNQGYTVLPGISDSHTHLLHYGSSRLIPLDQGTTVEHTVSLVREYILSNPEFANNKSKPVEGWGWNHMQWPTKAFPTAADLDKDPVIAGRPVILESKDGHAFWVSGTTLKANAPYPKSHEGGTIERDEKGDPIGIFLDNAQSLIKRPVWTYEDRKKRFDLTVRDAFANGLTSVHDAMLDDPSLAFFRGLAESGELPIRLRGFKYFDPEDPTYWGNITTPIDNIGNGRYSARSVKFVGDGAMRSGGAAMKEPYSDRPSELGFMRVSAETLNRVIPWYLRDGWQVNAHAIGDRANGIVLDAFEAALKGYDTSLIRPRLEHAQIMTQEDLKRLGRLGLIASIQPTHVTSDMWFAEPRIGPERVKGLYAFRSMLDGGARITLGTDFPVENPNPFLSFYAAITRLTVDGDSPHGPGGWFPEQTLTRLEALRGMTIDPAYASFTESFLGSLEVGKKADFVIISQDIMSVPAAEIPKTKVLTTVLDGVPVYGHLP